MEKVNYIELNGEKYYQLSNLEENGISLIDDLNEEDRKERIQKEIHELDLKIPKDFKKFIDLCHYIGDKYRGELGRGRFDIGDYVNSKLIENFDNFPRQGFEYSPRLQAYKSWYDKSSKIDTYQKMKFCFDDLGLEHKRARIFGEYSILKSQVEEMGSIIKKEELLKLFETHPWRQ